jgi:hypothetical protein
MKGQKSIGRPTPRWDAAPMKLKPIILALSFMVALRVLSLGTPLSLMGVSFVSSVIFLESIRDFESLASDLSKKGMQAQSPALIMGKSGVRHEFAFAVLKDSGKTSVVVDTELSVKEVDEMKVLKFYVKVFDVSPEKAILCVSPRLAERASTLAKEYGLTVVEDEVPRKLIPKAADEVDRILGGA